MKDEDRFLPPPHNGVPNKLDLLGKLCPARGKKLAVKRDEAGVVTAIMAEEAKAINARRAWVRDKAPIKRDRGEVGAAGAAPLTGLALSGGGIRSASVCLGGLQALHGTLGIEGVDYLSTVSGGGYIGCSLTSGLDAQKGKFPFGSSRNDEDTDAVRHIRDFSKYLIPNGIPDLVTALAIFLRGLVANAILLAPFLFVAVWFQLWLTPDANHLKSGLPVIDIPFIDDGHSRLWSGVFPITHDILLYLVGPFLLLWALIASIMKSSLWRGFFDDYWNSLKSVVKVLSSKNSDNAAPASSKEKDSSVELHGFWSRTACALIVFTAIIAWLELQPYVLSILPDGGAGAAIKNADSAAESGGTWSSLLSKVTRALYNNGSILATIGAAITFLSKFLGDAEALADRVSSKWSLLKKFGAKSAWFIAGLFVPLSVWFLFLMLAKNSIRNSGGGASDLLSALPASVAERFDPQALSAFVARWTPAGLDGYASSAVLRLVPTPEAGLFIALTLAFFFVAIFLNPNVTSFFRLYRDRLSKAFIFDPGARSAKGDLNTLRMRLHKIGATSGPYPIINAALNLEGSKFANKRGRNADFFIFSPVYCGSMATGYVDSESYFREERDLDLGTAMAISGAAISPNMGAATIKPLVVTLAMLNMRLGYWIRNPREVDTSRTSSHCSRALQFLDNMWDGVRRSFLLVAEVLGRIDEKSHDIYLTDGGNIENLGLIELLRRRCKIIIAIDAEADPSMDFPSLVTLARFARTDLGVVIDAPWEELRSKALGRGKALESLAVGGEASEPPRGPHCAVCKIIYADEEEGLLFYFKASLSGDENDVILDYKRKCREFPHETTMDQFFGEHQLEAYRALGFHMLHEMLDPKHLDIRQGRRAGKAPDFTIWGEETEKDAARIEALARLRDAFLGAPAEPPAWDANAAPRPALGRETQRGFPAPVEQVTEQGAEPELVAL